MANAKIKPFLTFFAALLLAGAGCIPSLNDPSPNGVVGSAAALDAIHRSGEKAAAVRPGIERITLLDRESTATITVLRIDPASYDFKVVNDRSTPKNVVAWAAAHPDASVVVNAGFFLEDHSPAGILVSGGAVVGARSFDLDKSAILVLSPAPRIFNTAQNDNNPAPETLVEAVQSYPLLIVGGKAAAIRESGRPARRTFFAVDRNGNAYVGVATGVPLTLGRLAATLAGAGLNIDLALNLDGGTSSGLAVRKEDGSFDAASSDSLTPVPSVIVATPKRKGDPEAAR